MRSAWITSKVEVGEAFTIMRRSALPPTGSWSPNAAFSPCKHPRCHAATLPYPTTINPAELPVRVERHVTAPITSRRYAVVAGLAPRLGRCPSCLNGPRQKNLPLRL